MDETVLVAYRTPEGTLLAAATAHRYGVSASNRMSHHWHLPTDLVAPARCVRCGVAGTDEAANLDCA